MRKIISCDIAAVLLALILSGNVSAAEKELTVIPVDTNGKMKIELSMPEDCINREIFIYVLKPGKTADSLEWGNQENNTDALTFTSQLTYDGSTEDIEFTMGDAADDGVPYTCYAVSEDLTTASFEFTYYSKDAKEQLLQTVNSYSVTADAVKNIHSVFSLQYVELYNNISDDRLIAGKMNKLAKNEGNIEIENVDELFIEAVLLSAAEKGILSVENVYEYNSVIGISDEFVNEFENLNENGKKYFTQGIKQEVNTAEELKKTAEKAIATALVYGNKAEGNGVLSKVVAAHESFFESNGLDIGDFDKSSRDSVGAKLMSEGYREFDEMIERINNLTSSSAGSSGSGSGGSSGSSGGSGGGNKSSGSSSVVNSGINVPAVLTTDNTTEISFSDIGEAEWARESIERLFKAGVVSGKAQGIFAPNDSVTREEFVKMICGAFELEKGENNVLFHDVSRERWSFEAITIAASRNIISGDGINFRPTDLITREDMAAILMRILKNKNVYPDAVSEKEPFADADEISEYARESVDILRQNNVISGRENNKFCPKATATRAEAAAMICRVMDLLQ